MGIWSWIRGSPRKSNQSLKVDPEHIPELVFLLDATIPAGLTFIQGAIRHALGVSLPTDATGDSTEFVTGEYPYFFLQFDGRLMQIRFMDIPYFDREARKFVSGDPDAVVGAIQGSKLQQAVASHKGWVAVSFMKTTADKQSEDPYFYVGKMLSAFGPAEITAIIWPAGNAIRLWNDEMLDALKEGRPLELFKA